jgi:hypothetical protein
LEPPPPETPPREEEEKEEKKKMWEEGEERENQPLLSNHGFTTAHLLYFTSSQILRSIARDDI